MKRSVLSSTESCKYWLLARYRHYKHHKRKLVEPEQLPHKIRFGYAMGHVLNDLCASMWFTYLLVFYTVIIGMSPTLTGVIMIIGQIADACATPFVGFCSDRGSTRVVHGRCFGRRKGWYLAGTVMVICSEPFLFSPCFPCPDCSDIVKVSYYSIFIIMFQFGWAGGQTIHLAMAADLTPHESERTFLLALRNTMTAICNSLTYIGQWISIAFQDTDGTHSLDKHNILSFQVVVFSILVLGALTSALFLIIVPEDASKFRTMSLESTSAASEGSSVHQPIKVTLSKWRIHYIGFIYLSTRVFVVSVQSLLTLYLHQSLNAHAYELASVPLVLNVFCFGASLATSPMNELLGRKISYAIGTLFGIGAVIWTFFGAGDLYSHGLIYIVATLYGIASALLQVTALSLIAQYIGEDINNGAFIYGYMSFLDKVSTGLVLALIMHFQPLKSITYFTYAVTITCTISSILGTVAICLLHTPSTISDESLEAVKRSYEESHKKLDGQMRIPEDKKNIDPPMP